MKSLYSLSGITAFVVTVQTGSFTEAAVRLGITKSAVGKSVGKLEEHLGVSLLIRTTRRVTLTTEGERYYRECVQALEQIERASHQIQAGQERLTGKLRLDLPAAFGRKCVMPLLMEWMNNYPELKLNITFSERYIDLIEEGVDLVIRIGKVPDSSYLVARQLSVQQQILCATPAYLQQYGEPDNIDSLDNHRCIVGVRQESPFLWILREGDSFRHYTPVPFYELADGEAMLQAVLSHKGIAQFPLWLIADKLKEGHLQRIMAQTEGYGSPINLIWPKGRSVPPKTRYLIDKLLQAAEKGWLD
ncbi:LysR family transcriptional regulator [Providencia rettgeri]|nr:LysR family transcriptional regulator [Providencia rettgeri]